MVRYNSLLCSDRTILFTGANGTYCRGLRRPKITRFAERYSETRVHTVHCEAKSEGVHSDDGDSTCSTGKRRQTCRHTQNKSSVPLDDNNDNNVVDVD